MKSYACFRRSAFAALCFVLAVAGSLGLLSGCSHPPVSAMLDEAFALVYPDLSARLVREFPVPSSAAKTAAKATSPYLSYPVQPGKIESLAQSIAQSWPSGSTSSSAHIFVASPAVAHAFPVKLLDEGSTCVSLFSRAEPALPEIAQLAESPSGRTLAIMWDSEWAYRQIGLIAGYRIGIERKNGNTEVNAAILFSSGLGRSEADLDAFVEAFRTAMETAGARDSDNGQALLPFNIDHMNLPGDKLEQALSALAQIKDKKPSLLVIAAGSRTALEKAQEMKDIELAADLRGLGQGIPTRNLFAAIGENNSAIIAAIRNAAQLIEKKDVMPPIIYVKPALQFSKEAARIDAILKRTAGQ
jgi:hypothetical protein